ncbi:pyruvate kinase [Sphaerotilus natans subsp. natans DSM 6575]|uniref:pyruvate kinase n=1 Tax=Sphaerotilus natans subsp. natans DSM 6575 TaxID=1286631 RepID=A0A059KFT4_9BURK|nr:pyruvate kinase [Sphaerotilus natans]KDB50337.1 pyruvate kinase [Sphaerotilus natans subsp. natans DSM 6575]SIR76111.1 pyruvate kinase [Sphaerotilus natans]
MTAPHLPATSVSPAIDPGWDPAVCEPLIERLWALRRQMTALADRHADRLAAIDPAHQAGARNLLHYLALRSGDLRPLQLELSRLGLSSLGRAEPHVLASIDKVLGLLHRLSGRDWTPRDPDAPIDSRASTQALQRHAVALLGRTPPGRDVRIMVTLPGEAAADPGRIDAMVQAGMDIARINCAHDTPAQWQAMVEAVRLAARRAGREVRVLMDLGGPKLRTGPIESGPEVVRLRPRRDELGRVIAPARLALRPAGSTRPVGAEADAVLGVDPDWLAPLKVGDLISLKDARRAQRQLEIVERHADGVIAALSRSAYLTADVVLRHEPHRDRRSALHDLPAAQGLLHLRRGDRLQLLPEGLGHEARPVGRGRRAQPASVSCTLPEALAAVRRGDRIWFDDGRIGGVVRKRLDGGGVLVEIGSAREGGEKLAADKGINLPDTALDLPALTAQDLQDLDTVVATADLVGLSFCQSADDVRRLRAELAARGASTLGLMLKIETQRGFAALPSILLAAMEGPTAGVMIARGDLAVECGYERLAEVQEEMLWACEAAHLPVVWATQVLETLARTGRPSRAEITDAAMGERAECVMLNKGPHIMDAIRMLDDILRRMQEHQSKKRPLLRALRAWRGALDGQGAPG